MFFVRTATQADLPKVSVLLGRSWHATYDTLYGVDKVDKVVATEHSVDKLAEKLARPDSEFVVADDGKRLGGMAYAAMDKVSKDLVQLHQIYVDPDNFGQGIGKDLFSEIETCFPDAKRMRLEVAPENARAVAFYERLGFHKVGEDPCHGAGLLDVTALILEKALSFQD